MPPSPLPLAIVGLAGAGKSEVAAALAERHGYARVYFGQVVLDELAARGLEPGPESERQVRERLRAEEGMDAIAARALPQIRAALDAGRRVCLDGLYSGAEWRLLARETGLLTVAVHAPRALRKARMAARAVRPLTGAELDARDLSEVATLDKAAPIALADAHLVNDGDLDALRRAVDALAGRLDELAGARLALAEEPARG